MIITLNLKRLNAVREKNKSTASAFALQPFALAATITRIQFENRKIKCNAFSFEFYQNKINGLHTRKRKKL